MNKIIVSLTVLTFLLIGVAVYAQGPVQKSDGFIPCGGYYKVGYGYHGQMMRETCKGQYQKFLDETAELRKELHTKKFEYFEAIRNPQTPPETISKLEKEIRELKNKVRANAPEGMRKGFKKACWKM
jgi:hypothetical protein